MKFRKKPVVIEAVQLNWNNWSAICEFLGGIINSRNPARYSPECSDNCGECLDDVSPQFIELDIPTLEGVMVAKHGDWIIKGVNGEFYPCKPDIFKATYEPVPDVSFGSAHRANAPAILPPDGRSA